MEKPKISVIVPIYNTQKFLKKCIDSILNQTFKDFELLLMIDGSPDNSEKICNQYAEKDKRIKVFVKENEGLEKTRRVGLGYAQGEYITHVDSDDWLELNAFEILMNAFKQSDADIVVAGFTRVMDRFEIIKRKSSYKLPDSLILDHESFMKDYYINFFGVNKFSVSMWAKLFKKSFLDQQNIAIGGFDMGEDLYYNIQVFPKATKLHFLSASIYYYRFGGMTTKLNEKIIDAAIGMYNIKKQYSSLYNKPEYTKYMIIEMINYLKSYVKMLIEYRGDNLEFIKNKIEKLLDVPEIIESIHTAKDYDYFKSDIFVKALVEKNTNQLIAIQTEIYKKEKFKNKLKRLISNWLK